jgi:RHH-type transcriptional regulator, rel operon repressor / antitoxin RelB
MNPMTSLDEWQIAGIKKAMASLDRREGVPHDQVKAWIESWGGKHERDGPKRSS